MTITIPAEQWVSIYALAGIAVGRQIEVQNNGATNVYLSDAATQPDRDTKEYRVAEAFKFLINDNGDLGAWAFSPQSAGRLNVRLVV